MTAFINNKDFINNKESFLINYYVYSRKSPSTPQPLVISEPISGNVEYTMLYDYKSAYDDTKITKGEKVELLNKNLNGWATVRYKKETLIVPYSFMTSYDRGDKMILNNR